jgi:heparosan-N-sulfate-glucuronate 5-epimerase
MMGMKNHLALALALTVTLLLIQCPTGNCTPTTHPPQPNIFFDKPAYYPPVNAFWNPEASQIQIKITITNKHIAAQQIKIKIQSSIDTKKITLQKTAPEKYEATIKANCLTLNQTPSLDSATFNVRYGDTITAKYTNQIQTTALIILPRYVLENFLDNTQYWQLFDSEGIPLTDYGPPTGIQYNPVEICHYALANYHTYMTTGNSQYKQKFLTQANWLTRNAKQKDSFTVWEYNFNWPTYNCTQPWVSAMAQGEALSVLTRAYTLTGNQTYLQTAQTAAQAFKHETTQGGVRYTDADGIWYEEYADTEAPSSKVLNGFIFSLFGLYEYTHETNNNETNQLFWEAAKSLSQNLHQYDTGTWSYYDLLHKTPAALNYHILHINQLNTMYKLTNIQTFQQYSTLFNSYI